ncbi:TPA: DNA-directed RNA polymerase subunit omega, partial [Enterococcus faecium]
CRNQLTDTQKKLDEATAENSSLKQYIQKLEKAKDEVEDTADKSQQIVEEHLRK